MPNTQENPVPEFLKEAIIAEGIEVEQVVGVRPEEVFSVFVEQPGGFGFTMTFQKAMGPGGKPVWLKIDDGREHGDE